MNKEKVSHRLINAAGTLDLGTVLSLLENRSNVNARNDDGMSAAMLADEMRQINIAEILRQANHR